MYVLIYMFGMLVFWRTYQLITYINTVIPEMNHVEIIVE
jgi:hypothetical protein